MVTKRPTEVKVGPHKYSILWSKASWDKYLTKGLYKELDGKICIGQTQIFVKGWDLAPSQQRDTLTHELCHSLLGLFLFSDSEIVDISQLEKLEEYVIRLFAPTWLAVLKENPHLVEWLCDEDE